MPVGSSHRHIILISVDMNGLKWTYGESNPGLLHAMEPCYRYTIGP